MWVARTAIQKGRGVFMHGSGSILDTRRRRCPTPAPALSRRRVGHYCAHGLSTADVQPAEGVKLALDKA